MGHGSRYQSGTTNVSTGDFIDLAEQKSGLNLGDFFQIWLYQEGARRAGEPYDDRLGCRAQASNKPPHPEVPSVSRYDERVVERVR
jgi:hypothetical protein